MFIGAAALALALAACGSNGKTNDTAVKGSTNTKTAAKLAVALQPTDQYGKILTDGDGHTLYVFDKDASTKPASACTGGCAANWPALTTSDGAGAGDGLDASLLGHNAANQYTYDGWPLYRFSGDTAAGDTNGQGIGGIWHIAGADSSPVMKSASTTTTAAVSGY